MANVRSDVFGEVVLKMEEIIQLEGGPEILKTSVTSMKDLLNHISNQFQSRQRRAPRPVESCLGRMKNVLVEAKNLIDGVKQQQKQGWCLPSRCLFPESKIRVWKARFDALLQELQMGFSISSNPEQIVSSLAPRLQRIRLLPVPNFVVPAIQSHLEQLQTWLAGQARVIGVYGAAGVGKTSLLKLVYNTYKYKKEVSGFFDVVIWFTVSRNFEIEKLQASIAEALNLSLEGIATVETRKMKLSASLERNRCLLILDNVSSKIDLDEVGFKAGDDNGSKILISSRSNEEIRTMGEIDFSVKLEPLSSGEDWELFKRGAFTNGEAPETNIEVIAKEMASACKGLPLAINVVAAAMSFKKTGKDWKDALTSMRKTDRASSSRTHGIIDAELDQLLRWSYQDLSDNPLKICFLSCAAFLEDQETAVETLLEMWYAEGLLNPGAEEHYLMDAGRHFINELVDRCLVECEYIVDDGYRSVEYLKIHEGLREMAIDIGGREKGEKCLFQAGQKLQSFPSGRDTGDCKRISVSHNDIRDLPSDLKIPGLQSLVLASNVKLEVVPQEFFSNIGSLRVLDLSCTSIRTLPKSVGDLGQLEFLNLSRCSKLVDLPDKLGDLSSLKVLNLNSCLALQALPSEIGKLKNLKRVKLDACYSLNGLPQDLSLLTSLNTLILPLMESTCAMSVEDLSNLCNLMELTTVVKSESNVGSMDHTWSKMRNLTLEYEDDANADRDAVAPDHVIIQNLENMKDLQNFHLINYQGETLPNSICELQHMTLLLLHSCYQLKALPALGDLPASGEIRSETAGNSFPMLEKLVLRNLLKLKSIGVWNEGRMSRLQLLVINNCPSLEKLPSGMKLPHLKELHITMCNQLTQLDIGSDGFPMLEMLTLDELNRLNIIEGSSGVWDERTMPKLQIMEFIDCPLLNRLPKGMEKLSSLRQINAELDWWQRIIWEDNDMKTSLSKLFVMI